MHPMHLETLELRTLLSSTLNNGVLSVTGTDAFDAVVIGQDLNGLIVVTQNGQSSSFFANQVSSINIAVFGGNDNVSVGVSRPCTIVGGTGNDTLSGSAGDSMARRRSSWFSESTAYKSTMSGIVSVLSGRKTRWIGSPT